MGKNTDFFSDNSIKCRKKLNFDTNLKIKSYQYYSFPLGIISANTNYYKNTIINKFTNIFMGETLQYYEDGYCEWKNFDIENIEVDKSSLITTIIQFISDNIYININLNEFFVPNRVSFKKYKFLHDCLIIGYDLNEKNFFIVGNDENRILKESKLSFEDFIKATLSFQDKAEIKTISLKKDFEETVNIKKVVKELIEYYSSIKPKKKIFFEDYLTFKFGISSYDKFHNILKNYENDFYLILNDIYFIYEHKYLLLKKLSFLCDNNIPLNKYIELYTKIYNETDKFKNLYIKFLITRKFEFLDKVILRFEKILSMEKDFSNEILTILKDIEI